MILDTIQTFLDSTKDEGWIYHPLDVLVRDLAVLRDVARSDAVRASMGKPAFLAPEGYVPDVLYADPQPEVKEAPAPAPVAEVKEEAPAPVEAKPAAKKTAKAAPAAENNNE